MRVIPNEANVWLDLENDIEDLLAVGSSYYEYGIASSLFYGSVEIMLCNGIHVVPTEPRL